MLAEAGLSRGECFVTNVARERPYNNDINNFIAKAKNVVTPLHRPMRDKMVLPPMLEGWALLQKEIELVKPTCIIALGNTPLWALTGHWGITKWRGSTLHYNASWPCCVIPTYHPAAILRQWEWRSIAVNDLRRAKRVRDQGVPFKPAWRFIIRPSFNEAVNTLGGLIIKLNSAPLRLSFDIETRNGHIACAGISWSRLDAICIPLMEAGQPKGYWDLEQETQLTWLLYKILTHPNARVIGQNIIYDSQYTYRHWHFVPRVFQDTMIAQHALFSALPKGLAFLASMYCSYYSFWKEEGKRI